MGASKLEYQELFNAIHREEDGEEIVDLPSFTPHEKWVMRVVFTWILVLSYVCFSPMNITQQTYTVGFVVNLNLVVFYGAPLSTITKVLKTRSSRSIHRRTMFMGLLNSFFWMCYGIALKDIVIFFPNFSGFVLSIVQIALCVMYKRDVDPILIEQQETLTSQQLDDDETSSDQFEESNENTRDIL
jgi:solute carrier family 50 protein (sugar transporter)